MNNLLIKCSAILLSMIALSACKGNGTSQELNPFDEQLKKARTILSGDIVLNTTATLGGEDKTLIKTGCPTIFNFEWQDDQKMILSLPSFHVGAMPFTVSFKCITSFLTLNTWEQEEYQGSGWIKFSGIDGSVGVLGIDGLTPEQKGSGAKAYGYLNTETQEVVFVVDYNMMSVKSNTFRQKIDKSRLARFDEERAAYEKALEEEKKRRGL